MVNRRGLLVLLLAGAVLAALACSLVRSGLRAGLHPVEAKAESGAHGPAPTAGHRVPGSPRRQHDRRAIGTNLGAFADYSDEWPLLDDFKRSRTWISGADSVWDDGRKVLVDADGWVKQLLPGQIARSVLFWSDTGKRPSGEYVVTYEGDGELDFWRTAEILSRSQGRYVIQVPEGHLGIAIEITRSNPQNPLRVIRVFLPGGMCTTSDRVACKGDRDCPGGACMPLETAAHSHLFHPDFLDGLRSYGVIRFMDWMFTNETTDRTWSERPKPDDARWTTHGVPVEVMVALTNQLDADPWFTLPHAADDEYVRRFAEYVKENAKSRRIYVEYANEVWNSQFPQSHYAEEEGRREGLSDDPFEARMRFYSRRATRIFRIFEDVFGGTDRLVRVMGSQAANPEVSKMVLGFEDAFRHTDALAIAPYLGSEIGRPEFSPRASGMSLDALMKELEGPAVDRAAKWIRNQDAVARHYGVKLVAYEGGQHLVGIGPLSDDASVNALFDAANRDPRMKSVYLRYLNEWRAAGGELFVHFSSFSDYSRWGRWGAVERVGQHREEAPKLDALMTYSERLSPRSP